MHGDSDGAGNMKEVIEEDNYFGLDLYNVAYLNDVVVGSSLKAFLWTDKKLQEVKDYLNREIVKFEQYLKPPTILKEDSSDFVRIYNALQTGMDNGKTQEVETIKKILNIDSKATKEDILNKTELLKKIQVLKLGDFEKILSETLKILSNEITDANTLQLAASTGYNNPEDVKFPDGDPVKRLWNSSSEEIKIEPKQFRDIINAEIHIRDKNDLIFKDKFYEKEAKDYSNFGKEAIEKIFADDDGVTKAFGSKLFNL